MPAQNRIGCDNRRHLTQQMTAETSPAPRQIAPLLVAESESPAGELTPLDAVLFDQIGDDILLLVVQPPGHGDENNPDEREVNHGQSLHSRRGFGRLTPAGRLVGHYAMLGRLFKTVAHHVRTVSQAANPVSPPSFNKSRLVTTLFREAEVYFPIWYSVGARCIDVANLSAIRSMALFASELIAAARSDCSS